MSTLYVSGIHNKRDEESVIKEIFLEATNNVEWLKKGELVLLKPALNSPDPYPATTHPDTIHIIAEILEEKGAKVVIGDQSGIEHVLHCPKGILKGSSDICYEKSGMKGLHRTQFVGFEKEGWNKGFYHFYSNKAKSWSNGFYLTNWVKKADHIINLPRLSTHIQAGVTLGFKNMVGLLREDSRLEFHMNGPLSSFMKLRAKQAEIKVKDDKSDSFFKKIVEISLALQSKLRLTLITASKAQITLGPDKTMLGSFFPSHIATLNPGIIIASTNQVAVEMYAISLLTQLYNKLNNKNKYLQKLVHVVNKQAKELGTNSVLSNPFISHAVKIKLGEENYKRVYKDTPEEFKM